MANHSPKADTYPLSKTWDEVLGDTVASGAAELPNHPEGYVKQVPPAQDGSTTPATNDTGEG